MILQLKNISMGFNISSGRVEAISDLSLEVKEGSFVSIIGPSGCGKSTIFKLISGLLSPDQGYIEIAGNRGEDSRKVISYMPQKDLLMPWRTILENVILSPEISRTDKKKAREEALKLFPLFGLEGFADSYPNELSGGMSQRAALLRTIMSGGEILLLDEPFGSLDAISRFKMKQWLQEIWLRFGKTIILITHDIEEAIFLSDSIYVLSSRPGKLLGKIEVPFSRPR
ncbi:MAG: ABC transporter ATP-binding protein, partial [Peptococcaceae bacterium]|nr:ABC transporter ATP-binding protein [Peptococcaceae bacterium]